HVVRGVISSSGRERPVDAESRETQPVPSKYRPDYGAVCARVRGLICRQNRIARVGHGGVARGGLQAIHDQPIGDRFPQKFAKLPQGRGPDFAVIVHFVAFISDVFISERISFITLPSDTLGRILFDVGAINRVVIETYGPVVRPSFRKSARLYF